MRKTLCIVLALILVVSGAIPVFAGTDESTQVKNAISYMKGLLPQLSDYPDFDYSFWQDDERNEKMLNLSWNNFDTNRTITALLDDKMRVHNIYSYGEYGERKGLGNLSKEEGQKIALDFLKKVNKGQGLEFEFSSFSSYTDEFTYYFRALKNGVPIDDSDFYVAIDKFEKTIVDYNAYTIDELLDSNYDSKSNILSENEGKAVYNENLGPELYTFTSLDYDDYTVKRFFAFADGSWFANQKFVDAKTGKLVERYNEYVNYESSMGMGAKEDEYYEDDVEIMSDSEIAAIEVTAGDISLSEAEAELKAKVPFTPGQRTQVYYVYDDFMDNYVWNIYYKNGYGSINASTKELLAFDRYDVKYSKQKSVPVEKALQTAEDFLKKTVPEKFEQCKYIPKRTNDADFVFARLIDGVPSADEQLNVTVDRASGKITHFDTTWYKGELPNAGTFKTEDDAFNLLAKDAEFGLKYVRTDKKQMTLVYDFRQPVSYVLDAKTLKKLDYRGENYFDRSKIAYTDIAGKWYENIVKKLYENGFYLQEKNDTFDGNEMITQSRFLGFLLSDHIYNYDEDEIYDYAISREILKKNEKAPDALVTRQGAAKILVRYLGLERAAIHTDIYKNLYSDKIQSGYEGYVALASAMNIFTKDSKNRFNGTSKLTNAQAAAALYNTLVLR